MPYTARKRAGKWRVVKVLRDGRVQVARGKTGKAVDGGGRRTKKAAAGQARAIMARKGGYPPRDR